LIRRFDDVQPTVKPNCDDSLSKSLVVRHGWAGRTPARESLFDLIFDPTEAHNVAEDAAYAGALSEMRGRLERWMRATSDPILKGPVAPPAGTVVNRASDDSPRWPPVQY
jgi:hypothetical protein